MLRSYPKVQPNSHRCKVLLQENKARPLSQGRAIRQTKKAARFNENQRSYLEEKFLIGQSTGIKADPSQVARDLRNARTESGKRRFSIDEFLTPQQIKSDFSRKAAKTKQAVADEEATE